MLMSLLQFYALWIDLQPIINGLIPVFSRAWEHLGVLFGTNLKQSEKH